MEKPPMSVATEEPTADALLRLMNSLERDLATMGRSKIGTPFHTDRLREWERLKARRDLLLESAK
jgi:hypothetical protein